MRAPGWAIASSATSSAAPCCCTWSTARRGTWCEAWRTVREELDAYGGGLADKPELLVLNKADAMTPREAASRRAALARASGSPVMLMSGATGQGVPEVLRALMDRVRAARARPEAAGRCTHDPGLRDAKLLVDQDRQRAGGRPSGAARGVAARRRGRHRRDAGARHRGDRRLLRRDRARAVRARARRASGCGWRRSRRPRRSARSGWRRPGRRRSRRTGWWPPSCCSRSTTPRTAAAT